MWAFSQPFQAFSFPVAWVKYTDWHNSSTDVCVGQAESTVRYHLFRTYCWPQHCSVLVSMSVGLVCLSFKVLRFLYRSLWDNDLTGMIPEVISTLVNLTLLWALTSFYSVLIKSFASCWPLR